MIYTFWEGQMPVYISLCLRTWNFPYVVLHYDNLYKYTNVDINKLQRFTLPQISDVIRVHVLRDNGGYWLDADTIMLSQRLPEENFMGNPEDRSISCAYQRTEMLSYMFAKWAQYQDKILDMADPPHHWSVFANDFPAQYLQENRELTIKPIRNAWPETYMIPGNDSRHKKYVEFYFSRQYHLGDIEPTEMLMLHNSWTPDWFKELSLEEVTKQDCTLSYILDEVNYGKA